MIGIPHKINMSFFLFLLSFFIFLVAKIKYAIAITITDDSDGINVSITSDIILNAITNKIFALIFMFFSLKISVSLFSLFIFSIKEALRWH